MHGRAGGRETPVGLVPQYRDIDWTGLQFPQERFDKLQFIDRAHWRAESVGNQETFTEMRDRLPPELAYERELLIRRL